MTIWRALAGARSLTAIGRAPLLLGSRLADTCTHTDPRARNVAHLAARPPSPSLPLSLSLSLFLSLFPLYSNTPSMSRARAISFLPSGRPVHGTPYIVTLRVKIHSRRRGSMTTTEQELPAARARTRYLCPEWEETAESSRAVCLWTSNCRGSKEPIAVAQFELADWFGCIKDLYVSHHCNFKWCIVCSCVRNFKDKYTRNSSALFDNKIYAKFIILTVYMCLLMKYIINTYIWFVII